jgi:HAD superfamily hydrolase (TIGR01509 family)
MFRAALFDLDGVLIDSETLYTEFWANVGRVHQLPSPTFAQDIKGTTLNDILTTYFSEPDVRRDVDRLLHEFENEIVYPIFDGALEFVDALRQRGLKTVIVTSSDEKKMDFLFNQHPEFESHFDAIVTACQVSHSKPHPEPYLVGAAKVDINPQQCLVFEDSFQGLEAGRRAGCRVIGIATTNSTEAIMPHADIVAPSLASLAGQIYDLVN